MAATLIIAEDPARAREKAIELLARHTGDRAFLWVPPFGSGPGTGPRLDGYQQHEEQVILGSRLAQLASWVDAVIAEGLEQWAENLHLRYPGNRDKIESERVSLVAVLDTGMAELVLITRRPASAAPDGPPAVLARTIEALRAKAEHTLEL
jgi:hypothetical protein